MSTESERKEAAKRLGIEWPASLIDLKDLTQNSLAMAVVREDIEGAHQIIQDFDTLRLYAGTFAP